MTISLLGLPWDASSSFQRGPALAPPAIRAALHSESTNGCNEDGVDVRPLLQDAGDLPLDNDGPFPLEAITAGAERVLATGAMPIFLGGDHSVTWPLVRAVAPKHPQLTILHFDAHPDLYDALDGSRTSHACPFARIMEEGLARRLVQVGIRAMNPHQQRQADRFKVEVVPMRAGFEAMRAAVASVTGPLYLSMDIDALDAAFAPGISHSEPGGLSVRELLTLIQTIPRGMLVAADVVELNPVNDLRDLTARVAATCVKEVVGRMG
ncbi:MAG: agmatinase family protein [Gemmatimonadota bacterium]|nr:agmatinase family protein [Gemmatimonadota bacterium]